MRTKLLVILIICWAFSINAWSYNFTSVDSLLNASLSGVFNNKVVCMVMHNDSLIYYYNRNADSSTVSLVASCSKTFSAALMLRLVQEGKIKLDDSIAHYYPQATSYGKGAITLRQLFAHTSGLSGNTEYSNDGAITLQQSADSILLVDTLLYTPIGQQFSYTGEDQQVAGAAAELANGTSWDFAFRTKIAQPLGLTNTNYFLTTLSNPRVAGGVSSNAADMLRFGQFILHNGRNAAGTQVVDSAVMQELWKDQTNHALQIYSPVPHHLVNNNPYSADTMYYSVGAWLDIYNPVHNYQEQISADGAFGGIIWVNRCTNMVGVFLTFPPSGYQTTYATEYLAMDMFRSAVPFTCYQAAGINQVKNSAKEFKIFPNPGNQNITLALPAGKFSIYIFDVLGKEVLSQQGLQGGSVIHMLYLQNGTYLVKAVGQDGVFNTTFQKL